MIRIALFILIFAFLTGCGRSQPTTYFAFETQQSQLLQDHLPKTTLRIARVAIPQYLEREAIVMRGKNGVALQLDSLNVWAEPLGDGIRRILYSELFEPLLKNGITVLPLTTESTGAYTLLFDVISLDCTSDAHISLHAQWSVLETKNNTIVCDGIYSKEKALENVGYADLVEAQGALVKDCAKHIVGQIEHNIRKK